MSINSYIISLSSILSSSCSSLHVVILYSKTDDWLSCNSLADCFGKIFYCVHVVKIDRGSVSSRRQLVEKPENKKSIEFWLTTAIGAHICEDGSQYNCTEHNN
jgi:hypothetical protein